MSSHSSSALPPLSIRLTEPITYLRGTATGEDFRGRRQLVSADAPPAVLRGLLTLRLTKASTRIKRIEVRLEGKVRTEWPEGIGPRRTETSEERIILSEGITFFSAAAATTNAADGPGPSTVRRALSVGPGAAAGRDDWDTFDLDDVEGENASDEGVVVGAEEERGRAARSGGDRPPARSASAMPITPTTASQGSSRWQTPSNEIDQSPAISREEALRREGAAAAPRGPSPAYAFRDPLRRPPTGLHAAESSDDSTHASSARSSRRSFSGPGPSSSLRDELVREEAAPQEDPIRPSLVEAVVGSSRSTTESAQVESPAEEVSASAGDAVASARSSRSDLRARATHAAASAAAAAAATAGAGVESSSSPGTLPSADYVTVTRPGTHRTSLVEQVPSPSASPRLIPTAASPHESSRDASLDSGHARPNGGASSSRLNGASAPLPSVTDNHYPAAGPSRTASSPPKVGSSSSDRGRKSTSKFSITNALRGLSQDVKERVGSRSRSRLGATLGRPPNESVEQLSLTRQETLHPPPLDPDFVRPFGRGGAGRSVSRPRNGAVTAGDASATRDRSESTQRGRAAGLKILNGMDASSAAREDSSHGSAWKEFRKGVYNYPIAFSIPADLPPTIHADFGSVVYRLRATVVRAGALSPNYVDEQEVTLVASPPEDDTEETENVIVERQWEDQMR